MPGVEEKKPELPVTQLDPATKQHLALPPALVEAVQDDPELLVQLTRGQLAVIQDKMVQKVISDPDVSVGALATVHERLSKNARMEKGEIVAGGGGAAVVINFVVGGKKETLTIDNTTGKPVDPPG